VFRNTPEQRIEDGLNRTGLTFNVVCALTAISKSTLSEAFSGVRPFSQQIFNRLQDTIGDVEWAQKVLYPIPVDISNPSKVRLLIDELKLASDQWPLIPDLILTLNCFNGVNTDDLAAHNNMTPEEFRTRIRTMAKKFSDAGKALSELSVEMEKKINANQ
jgi:hypothetical protein